jgi:phosphoglycerate dehydrogenase-like enzyme
MTLRCAILDDYQTVSARFADWSRLEGIADIDRFHDPVADVSVLAPYEIIVAMRERMPFREEAFAALPKLKLLVTTGMRNGSIDMEAATARGIAVCGTRGSSGSAAELTWALLLALVRRLPEEIANFRAAGPRWQLSVGMDLAGKRLGVVGLGRLGTLVAGYGRAFGMEVGGWSRSNTPEKSGALGIRYLPSLEALLEESDIVSLHLTLNPQTRHVIDAKALARMKKGAILVNTSRGPLVDEQALIDALRSGRLSAAGLDVYGQEPLAADHPFRTMANVVATPHIGYVTEATYALFYGDAVEDIVRWVAGDPVRVIA